MSLSTYTEFVSDIAGWLDRVNLTPRIPDFIKLAEIRLNRELRVSFMANIQEYTVIDTDDTDFELPVRFNGVRALKIVNNPTVNLTYITPENIDAMNLSNLSGSKHFTIIGNRLRIVPPPVTNDVIQMTFYQKAISLAPVTQETNVLTINAPDALLYGALIEAKPDVKDDARMGTWSNLYTQAIENIIHEDKAYRWGESSLEPRSPYGEGGSVATG